MFPVLEFSFTGLNPVKMYNVYVDMILADNHHWKFQNGKWIPVGEAEQLQKSTYLTFITLSANESEVNIANSYFRKYTKAKLEMFTKADMYQQ